MKQVNSNSWSGQKQMPVTETVFQAENWKSKLGNNAQASCIHFGCHSVEDDLQTNVCGIQGEDSEALGSEKCGESSASAEGYCGPSMLNGTRIGLNHASCKDWPHNGGTICPVGFTLKWSSDDNSRFASLQHVLVNTKDRHDWTQKLKRATMKLLKRGGRDF